MKKYFAIVIMLFFLAGCGGDTESENTSAICDGTKSDDTSAYCDDPALLGDKPCQMEPGFIIYLNLKDGVTLRNELNRLQSIYDMDVINIYDALDGFFAEMLDDTMEQIRCEETVESIYYNGPPMSPNS